MLTLLRVLSLHPCEKNLMRIATAVLLCLACAAPVAASIPTFRILSCSYDMSVPAERFPEYNVSFGGICLALRSTLDCSILENSSVSTLPEFGSPRQADLRKYSFGPTRLQTENNPFPVRTEDGSASWVSSLSSMQMSTHQPEANNFLIPLKENKKWEVEPSGINWWNVFGQSMYFLGIEHGFRLLDPKQPYTREALKGPFFKDWFDTVKDLKGWSDSDPAIINYIGHPIQGAISGRILLQNDPKSKYMEFGWNRQYQSSRLKAFWFAFFYGLQFELGPISEASIGNSQPTPAYPHPTSYVDLVITPTVGTAWLVTEDLADRYLMGALERRISNRKLIILFRTFSNPGRSMSNFLRFKRFWYRDNRDFD